MSKLESAVFVCGLAGGPTIPGEGDGFDLWPRDKAGQVPDGCGYSAVGPAGDFGAALYQFTSTPEVIAKMRADKARWADPESMDAKAVLEKCPKCKALTDKQDWKASKAKANTLAALGVSEAEYSRAKASKVEA